MANVSGTCHLTHITHHPSSIITDLSPVTFGCKFESYALCDQIRRAIVSVPSNLAEGSGRTSIKEQLHFYEIAYGSLMETYNQLIIAADLKYIGEHDLDALRPKIDTVARMLNGLRSALQKKLNSKPNKP